jgi:fumarate reductase flavoprotein subunit
VAGDTMAEWVKKDGSLHEADASAVQDAISRCERPFLSKTLKHGSLEPLRERLYEVMWEKVGIIRDAGGLRAALSELNQLEDELKETGIAGGDRAFNLSWHDWLNLRSLAQTSRVIAEAALARTDSRGAHYREDFPATGPLERSAFTSLRMDNSEIKIDLKPVAFTRVRPGESLLGADAKSAGHI